MYSDKRKSRRVRVGSNFGFLAMGDGRAMLCHLRNLNETGAKLEVVQGEVNELEQGLELSFRAFPEWLQRRLGGKTGAVVWRKGRWVGVEIDPPVKVPKAGILSGSL